MISSDMVAKVFILSTSIVLSSCVHQEGTDTLFDVPQVSETKSSDNMRSSDLASPRKLGKVERPPVTSAVVPLGHQVKGPGYSVGKLVESDGRFHRYKVTSAGKAYVVTGDALMQKHLLELQAVETLKQQNRALAVAEASWSALSAPVKGAASAIANPVKASRQGYTNIKDTVKSVGKTVQGAANYVKNVGDVPPDVAEREEDGFIEGVLGRSEARRKLAYGLKVDPYTHFIPLRKELDAVAGYKAAGQFGVETALGFVPGVGGLVVSGISSLDEVTRETLVLEPDGMADKNRSRLREAGMNAAKVQAFIISPIYTPTEKTLLTGALLKLRSISGFGNLLDHAAVQTDRSRAFAVFEEIELIRLRTGKGDRIQRITTISGMPVLHFVDGDYVIIAAYDQLAWTQKNASHFTKLAKELRGDRKTPPKVSLLISGKATKLSKRQIQQMRWKIDDSARDAVRTMMSPNAEQTL